MEAKNYLVIQPPLPEPWRTLEEYITGWYFYHRLKRKIEGLERSLHVVVLRDNHGSIGTIMISVEGSPPKGRLVIEFDGISISAITFIGERIRKYRSWEQLPEDFQEAIIRALPLLT